MSERIVDNPANHGWVEENGKWVWAGGASAGHIADGTIEGQVTTWDVAQEAWTPESSLTIDAAGDSNFSGDINAANASFTGAVNGVDAEFTGIVEAAGGFTVNGQPISSGGGGFSGNNLIIENTNAPEDQRQWRFNVNQQNGRLRLQPLNDDGSAQSADWIAFRQETGTITTVASITAPDFIASSDERLKDNITTAPVGLIDSLKGREWDWASGEKGSGVVAQELEKVLPHLVHENDEGMKSVSYNGLVAYLIEEVKALKAEVEALK